MKSLRPAVAMLELIFAIVVMGIVLMSAPMLMSTASKSGYVGIQQEAINEAAAHLNMIMGYHWDEGDSDENFIDPILTVNHGDPELNKASNERRRGTDINSSRSYVREDGVTDIAASAPSTFGEGKDEGNTESFMDDMDDFHNTTRSFSTISASSVDYADNISLSTEVSYLEDNTTYDQTSLTFIPRYNVSLPDPLADTSNIKHLQATLTSNAGVEELSKTIILHAFSCNIGAYTLHSRSF